MTSQDLSLLIEGRAAARSGRGEARLRPAIGDLEDAEDPRVVALAGSMSALLYPDGSAGAIEKAERDRRVEIAKQLDHLREMSPAAADAFERNRARLSMPGGVLYSGQLPDTADHALYTARGSAPVETRVLAFSTVPGITGVSQAGVDVNVWISVVPAGASQDSTHTVSWNALQPGYSVIVDALLLGPGDAVHAQAGVGGVINVMVSGLEDPNLP